MIRQGGNPDTKVTRRAKDIAIKEIKLRIALGTSPTFVVAELSPNLSLKILPVAQKSCPISLELTPDVLQRFREHVHYKRHQQEDDDKQDERDATPIRAKGVYWLKSGCFLSKHLPEQSSEASTPTPKYKRFKPVDGLPASKAASLDAAVRWADRGL